MSYYVGADRQEGRRLRWSGGAAARREHHKFTRVEPLEGRLLFNTAIDHTFGVGGRSRIDVANFGDAATALHVLPDGRVLVAGNATYGLDADLRPVERAFVARLNADGSLDGSFGAAGVAMYADASAPVVRNARALAVGADGRIFVGGSAAAPGTPDTVFAVAAFTAAGAADATFGTAGVGVLDFMPQADATDGEYVDELLVQADGKIVAVGVVGDLTSDVQAGPGLAVARFNANGSLDSTFTPSRHVAAAPHYQAGIAAALQPDGKLVVAERRGSTQGSFSIRRYNTDGTFDASFGDGGRAGGWSMNMLVIEVWKAPDPAGVCDVLVQPDGKIVTAFRASASSLHVFRHNADGTVDATFGDGDGSVELPSGPLADVDVEPAADGGLSVVSVGNWSPAKDIPPTSIDPNKVRGFQAYAAQLNAVGETISSTHQAGTTVAGAEELASVALLPDGKLLAAGVSFPTANAGEGAAWDQSADALLVRFDPAGFTPAGGPLPSPVPITGDPKPPPGAPPQPQPPAEPPAEQPAPKPIGKDYSGSAPPAFSGRTTVAGGRFYAFKLQYRADADAARNAVVGVYAPGGEVTQAQPLKVRPRRTNLPSVEHQWTTTVSYRVAAPGGKFDAADNGQYAVRLGIAAGAPGAALGSFTVAAKPARPGPGVRRLTGTLGGDLRQFANVPPSWQLERNKRPPLALDVTSVAGLDAFAGQRVTVTGSFRTVATPQGGKSRVFVVTSIRAAAP